MTENDAETGICGAYPLLPKSGCSNPEYFLPFQGVGEVSTETCKNGAPERIRTSGLCLRRAALYPAELRVPVRCGIAAGLKARND